MPRMTVILPVRNGERYLRVAVRSTLQAMPSDSELVVLNDGSTDGTQDVLDSIESPHLKILKSPGGEGLAKALNLLVESTDSELIARMDADDVVLPWRFAHQLRAINSADVVFSPVIHLGPKAFRLRPTRVGELSPQIVRRLLAIENPIAHSTALFRRHALDAVGGYRTVLSEDYDLWLRIAARDFRIRRTGLPVLLYRHHAEQVTKDPNWASESRIESMLVESHRSLVESTVGISGDSLTGLRDPHANKDAVLRSLSVVRALDGSTDNYGDNAGSDQLRRKVASASRLLEERAGKAC